MGCFKVHENNFFVVQNLSDYTKNSNDSHDSKNLSFDVFQESDCNVLIFKRKSFEKNNRSKNRAKHYNPSTGRFLSEDLLGLRGRDDNLYRYVSNNPNRFIDPYGLLNFTPITTPNPVFDFINFPRKIRPIPITLPSAGFLDDFREYIGDVGEAVDKLGEFLKTRQGIKRAVLCKVIPNYCKQSTDKNPEKDVYDDIQEPPTDVKPKPKNQCGAGQ